MTCALILGRAKGLWEEIELAKALTKFDYIIAVGPIAVDYPGDIDCWVWFHAELFPDFSLRRARKGFAPVKSYWSSTYRGKGRQCPGISVNYVDGSGGGSSGLIATNVALDVLKVDRVVLAGIPMTAEGGQYDSPKLWPEAVKHQHAWKTVLPKLLGRVRSFSGWTLELLEGKPPTADWLNKVSEDCLV